ncbi:CAP domain-containing protein [Sphingomonas sp. JC676]|uniref:CAP domain-containing protein n=1 Tax=Sphingomonas sp. JC676 TaxID=2768065 RepID=UPI0016580066|nr:CAP domain-containing protein [Sphingomonas sp. JC676]MBC9031419.1 CAP domain-containing protein [Sphingomonas sp. JC676]
MLLPIALLAVFPPPQTALERDVIAQINFARTQPREYAEWLREYRARFRGKVVRYPGNPSGLLTKEGTRAVDEAIDFLERQTPLPPIAFAPLLARAADDHVADQGPRGATGHLSRDGSDPRDRVQRRGGGAYVAEVITYGPPTGPEVVRQFIVDDAVPGRGHRKTVFAGEMRFAGVGCGTHRIYRTMCVVEFGRTETGAY